LGIIKGGDELKLVDLKINPISGVFNIPQKFEEPIMAGFFKDRIIQFEALPKPSDKQQDKIEAEMLKDKEKFWSSDAGQSIYNDVFNLDKEKNK
jgi:hypothetical protein